MKKSLLSSLFVLSAFALQAETFQVDFSSPEIVISRPKEITAKVSVGPGTYYNGYYEHSWIMHYNGNSYIEISFSNNLPEGREVSLDLVHLSSLVYDDAYSPITITLNNSVVAKDFSPFLGDCGYQSDSFDITSFVKTGENKLRLSFGDHAISNYWIQTLEVNFK